MKKLMTICTVVAMMVFVGQTALADYSFTDQTPITPIVSGAYQRYVTMLSDGTNMALWYENRTATTIEMRTSINGYEGFGTPTTTIGLSGLDHPKIFSDGGTGYAGFFRDTTASPDSITRLTSSDGITWSNATQITVSSTPFTTDLWGVVGFFENISGTTDVMYYTQGIGANEKIYRATASDGANFTHQGTAFANPGTEGLGAGVSVGSQILWNAVASEFLLLWCGESTTMNIGYATSSDGLTFVQQSSVILDAAGHTDLEETSFVINGASLVGVYTGDFDGNSDNHIGAYTGAVPEPATLCLLGLGGLLLRRKRRA